MNIKNNKYKTLKKLDKNAEQQIKFNKLHCNFTTNNNKIQNNHIKQQQIISNYN